jgi:hypothetical protein
VIPGDDPPPLQGSPHLEGPRGNGMAAGPTAVERDLAAGPGAAGMKDSIAPPRSYALQERITASNDVRSSAARTVGGDRRVTLPDGLVIVSPVAASRSARAGRTRNVTSRPA